MASAAGEPPSASVTSAGADDSGKNSIKEMQQHFADELAAVRDLRRRVEGRAQTCAADQQTLLSSLQTAVPGFASSLDLSLRIISAFNNRPPPPPTPAPAALVAAGDLPVLHKNDPSSSSAPYDLAASDPSAAAAAGTVGDGAGNDPSVLVRSMVAVCLLERVPFAPMDSAAVLRKVEADPFATAADKAALLRLGGEAGPIAAVEAALRAIAEDTGAVELEDFGVGGKSRVLVFEIDRSRLVKELSVGRGSSTVPRQAPTPPRPKMMGTPRGVPSPKHKPPPGPLSPPSKRMRTEEDDMKDLEELLNKKSFRELQKSKQGEELLDLIHRPTAKETAVAAKFKTKGGSQVKEYCTALTKEDCRRQSGSYIACEKLCMNIVD